MRLSLRFNIDKRYSSFRSDEDVLLAYETTDQFQPYDGYYMACGAESQPE